MTNSSTTGTRWNGLRRTPFTRKPLPIASKPMFAVRVPLKPRSKATEKRYVERRALVARLLAARPVCERCRTNRSVDIHEPKTRARGGSILDESNCVALCRICHSWVHDNVAEATKEGWLISRWA